MERRYSAYRAEKYLSFIGLDFSSELEQIENTQRDGAGRVSVPPPFSPFRCRGYNEPYRGNYSADAGHSCAVQSFSGALAGHAGRTQGADRTRFNQIRPTSFRIFSEPGRCQALNLDEGRENLPISAPLVETDGIGSKAAGHAYRFGRPQGKVGQS